MSAHLDQTACKTHEVGRGAKRSAERLILMLVPTVTADVAQNATPVVVKQKGTGKGINVGADFSYNLVSRYSVGGFVRYAGGVARLESHSSFKVGGVQAGGGLRVRF